MAGRRPAGARWPAALLTCFLPGALAPRAANLTACSLRRARLEWQLGSVLSFGSAARPTPHYCTALRGTALWA